MKEHTSKELSQKLHEKGFRAEHGHGYTVDGEITRPFPEESHIPAYTFTELWMVVPSHIDKFDLFTRKGDNGLCIVFYAWIGNLNDTLFVESHKSPAEALGLLVEWLLDNGHMEVSQKMSDKINRGAFIEDARRLLKEHGLPELQSGKFVDALERIQNEANLAEGAFKALTTLLDKYEEVIGEASQ